jgi:aminoglycoside 3-N-acetyltransferase
VENQPPVDAATEHAVIAGTIRPFTRSSVGQDLARLGVAEGDTLIVHSSLSKLGWVVGGAQAVVEALLDAVGPDGTLIMPTHSSHWTEPAHWQNPPLNPEWFADVYAALPAFDPAITPTTHMGAIVECFRHVPGLRRSNHPAASFAAVGKHTDFIVDDHRLESWMGEHSPMARAYDLDAKVLLLGVGHGNNSSLHLAEHRAEWKGKKTERQGAAILVDGVRQWVVYEMLSADESDFVAVGADFDATGQTELGKVGHGDALLMSQRALVDFATAWMGYNRPRSLSD